MGRDSPRRWRSIREALRKQSAAYLAYDEFERIAADKGLEANEARFFASIAHQLVDQV